MYTRVSTTLQILTKSYTTLQNFLQLFFYQKLYISLHNKIFKTTQTRRILATTLHNITQRDNALHNFTELFTNFVTLFFSKKQYLATLVQNNKEVQPFYNFRTLYTILQHYTQLYTTLQQCTTLYTTLHNSERSNVRQLFFYNTLHNFYKHEQNYSNIDTTFQPSSTFVKTIQNYT